MTVCAKFDCQNAVPPKVSGRGLGRNRKYCSARCRSRVRDMRSNAKRWQWATIVCPWCGVGLSTREPARIYCSGRCQKRAYYWNHTRKQPKEWWE